MADSQEEFDRLLQSGDPEAKAIAQKAMQTLRAAVSDDPSKKVVGRELSSAVDWKEYPQIRAIVGADSKQVTRVEAALRDEINRLLEREVEKTVISHRDWFWELTGEKHERPFVAKMYGELWECATDGNAVVMLRGLKQYPLDENMSVDNLFEFGVCHDYTAPFREVLSWAAGFYNDRQGLPDKDYQPGCFFGRYVNRRLLWKYLRNLEAKKVGVCIPNNPTKSFLISGDPSADGSPAWMVLCAPLHPETKLDDSAPAYPATFRFEKAFEELQSMIATEGWNGRL